MTLTELLPMVRQLSAPDKLKLIRILAEELDTNEDISPLEAHKIYYLLTPYNSFGAGETLMQAMQLADLEVEDRKQLITLLKDLPELATERSRQQILELADLKQLAPMLDLSGAP